LTLLLHSNLKKQLQNVSPHGLTKILRHSNISAGKLSVDGGEADSLSIMIFYIIFYQITTRRMARQNHFSGIINNQNNPRILFNTIDRHINHSPEFLSIINCNEFSAHFRNKVLTIRKNINQTREFNIVDSTKHFNYTFHSFTQVKAEGLSKVIAEINPITCILDPIPTSFLKLF